MDCASCRTIIKKDVIKCIPCNKHFHPSCHGLHKIVDELGHYSLCKGQSMRVPSSPVLSDVFVDASSLLPGTYIPAVTTTSMTYSTATASVSTIPSFATSHAALPATSMDFSSLCNDIKMVLQSQSDVKALLQSHTVKLNQCTEFIQSQKSHNIAIGNSIASLTSEINSKFESLAQDYKVVTTKVTALETSFASLKTQVDSLQSDAQSSPSGTLSADQFSALSVRFQRFEQEQIACDVLISGVPESTGENLTSVIIRLCELLQVTVSPRDIVNVRRMPSRLSRVHGSQNDNTRLRPRTILLRFATLSIKSQLLAAKRQKGRMMAAEISSSFGDSQVIINDFIPKDAWSLLKVVKTAARERGYRFAWYSRGRVLIKKDTNSAPIVIVDEKDIDKKMA